MTEKLPTLIAGQWRDASGPEYTTEYPADGSTVATLHAATAGDVDEAVQAAELARQQPAWANLKRHEALRVGDPASERTQMGPLVNRGHRASVERYVQLGLDEGGKLLFGGTRPSGAAYDKGSYYLPTVIEGLPNTARMCQEEIFGPVLALLPWSDEADLIAQCNDNVYGLAAGIWTRDYKTVWRLGHALQTGTVWVNTYKQFSVSTPFGGLKMSGTGREKGRLGILEYTSQKSFYWGLNDAPLAWSST